MSDDIENNVVKVNKGGAPLGNQNARSKPWNEALRKAVLSGKHGRSLEKIADKLIDMALNGSNEQAQLGAIKELADRLDGKAKQSIDHHINQHDVSIDQLS